MAAGDGRLSPICFMGLILVIAFLGEWVIMSVLNMPAVKMSVLPEAAVDSFVLTAFLFPVLYFLSYRPLTRQIEENRLARERIQLLYDELDHTLRNLMESFSDPMVVIDTRDYTVPLANSAARRQRAGERSRCYNMTWGLDAPCDVMGLSCPIETIKRTKEPVTMEVRLDGGRWREVRAYPVLGGGGEVERIIEYMFDVSERKEAEEAQKQANKELRKTVGALERARVQLIRSEKMAALGGIAAGVAHELKNPLNIISTSVQLLSMEEGMPEEFRDTCKMIQAQVGRCVKIIENLRDFARKKKPEMTEVDLHDLLNKTVELLEYEMKVENIKVERRFSPDPVFVEGDEDQLAQVFLNLIGNARDAMKERQEGRSYDELAKMDWTGRLIISTSVEDSAARVKFLDTGGGVPEEVIRKIFDPFFTTKGEDRGTGLGLAISKDIVENHHGRIELENHEGEGASFNVVLPTKAG
ncbi:MAG: ATP-binding protein [Candidatus Nitrospinota bacterium M3_3B_026]